MRFKWIKFAVAAVPVFFAVASIHADTVFNFTGPSASLTSTDSSATMTADGGTLTSAGYVFGADQGLNVSNLVTNNYSILLTFELSDTSGYRKLIDFKNQASDNGLYNLDTDLNYYNFAFGPAGPIQPGVQTTVVLTRDSATQLVTGYVDGVQQIQFTDTTNDAVFSASNGIMRLLRRRHRYRGSGSQAARHCLSDRHFEQFKRLPPAPQIGDGRGRTSRFDGTFGTYPSRRRRLNSKGIIERQAGIFRRP